MNAKDFLAKKGVYNLDTKKRYNEVIAWMEEYAALRQLPVSGSSFDWDKFANALKDEFGESLVEEDGSEKDAYNWWLTDVTVADIVEFCKNYR